MDTQINNPSEKGGWTRIIEHKGKKIILQNARNCSVSEGLKVMDEGRAIIRSQEPKSVLSLVDVRGADFNQSTAESLKEYAKGNGQYTKKSAAVGISGLKKIIFKAMIKFSGRDIKLLDDLEEAKEYLVKE